jgi:hypothetical protein
MQSVPITTDVVSSNLDQERCTTLCDKVCQRLTTGRWFSPDSAVSSTNKTARPDTAEILLKVALNTIKPSQTTLFETKLLSLKLKLEMSSHPTDL